MAKQIFIKFTIDGAIVQAESSAANIRQGDSNGEVSIIASVTGRTTAGYLARVHFERPDGKKANVVMTPSSEYSDRFVYVCESAWFFAVPGQAKVTVTITDSGGAVSAQGTYEFAVAATTVDVIDSTLTYDEAAALEGLIAQQSEALQSAVAKLMNGETVVGKALRDADGNIISQTYAQDSRVVHLEGNERVYGTKEFVGTIKANSLIPHAGNSAIGDSEDGRWGIGYFKYVDLGYLKAGNLLFTLPNAGGVLVTEAGAQSIANTAKEQAIAFSNTYTDNQKNALQTEIDAINATQNVVDIVGTKANLLAYDTTNLQSGDKIEVLVDESQNGANTIYSFENSAWALIGSKAPYYSVAQIDALLAYYVTAIGLSTTLEDYATKAYLADAINENCITLDKGGYVNLAEDPATANTHYFGAKHGTKSFHQISDNAYAYRVSDDDGNLVQHNANKNGVVSWLKTANGVSTITKVPFKSTAGAHDLAFQDDLDAANAKIAKQESDIQYLYRQVIGGGDLITDTDSDVSLTSQPFPLTVSPKALLDYVGGMCKKCENLYPETQTPVTGTIYQCRLEAGTYTISLRIKTAGKNAYVSLYKSGQANPVLQVGFVGGYDASSSYTGIVSSTFTVTEAADKVAFYNSVNGVDVTDIMLVKGSTAKTYEPFFEGIKTAPVTKVVSKGFNLWDEEWEVGEINGTTGEKANTGYYIRSKNFINVFPNTTYYAKSTQTIVIYQYDDNGVYLGALYGKTNDTFTTASNCSKLLFATASGGTTYNHDICINVSNATMNGTYMPYRAPIEYPIPAEVRALEGYGLGKDAEHYNYIDFNRKMFVKETAIDGDDITILAEPVETDISEYIDSDVIEVSAGGHLEFENEDDVGVPYSVTYQCEPETQGEGE